MSVSASAVGGRWIRSYVADDRGRWTGERICEVHWTCRTYRIAPLAADRDHQHALSVGHDLLAEFRRLRSEVRAPNHTELNDTVHDESEADGILLFPDEARGSVDYECQGTL